MFFVYRTNVSNLLNADNYGFLWCQDTGATPCLTLYSSDVSGGKYYLSINNGADLISTGSSTFSKTNTYNILTLGMAIVDGLQYITIRRNGTSLYSNYNYTAQTLPFAKFLDTKTTKLIGFTGATSYVQYNSIFCYGLYDLTQCAIIEEHLMYKVSQSDLLA